MPSSGCAVTIVPVTDTQFLARHNAGFVARCSCGHESDMRADEAKARDQLDFIHRIVRAHS